MNWNIFVIGLIFYFYVDTYTSTPEYMKLLCLLTILFLSYYYDSTKKIEYFNNIETNKILKNYMEQYEMTAGQLSISKNNSIVLSVAEGYNSCDSNDKKNKITTDMVMRIASTSKPITAVAILMLQEMGKLNIDEKIVQILSGKNLVNTNLITDNRVYEITIKHLLYHEGGFSNSIGMNDGKIKDPQYDSLRIAAADKTMPASKYEIIKYVFTQPLNYDPGSKSEYSNFGYNILGRIIEIKSGETYEQFVQNNIFKRINIYDAYIGNENYDKRGEKEIINCDTYEYSMYSIDVENMYPIKPSYGSFILDVMDSHGGWVMSAESLAKFGNAVVSGKLLSKEYIKMIEKKSIPSSKISSYQGIGFVIDDIVIHDNRTKIMYHYGALTDGTFSLLMSIPDLNIGAAAIFNHMNYYKIKQMSADLKDIMLNMVNEITEKNI